MKRKLLALTIALAGCTAAEAATSEECCMPPGQGQIFASGISILLKGPNEALQIADGNPPIKYLHFVDGAGQTIVPTYEPDGLDAGQGSKIGGAKLVMASAGEFAALETRVTQLETALTMPPTYIAPAGYSSPPTSVSAGQTIRVDCGALGADEGVTITLPLATAENKGYEVTIIETSGNPGLGATNVFTRLEVLASGGQPLEACVAAPGYYMTGVYPTVTFASTGSGWVRKSYSSQ